MKDATLKPVLEAVKTAIITELRGFEIYRAAVERCTDPSAKLMFQSLADDEEMHLEEIEDFDHPTREKLIPPPDAKDRSRAPGTPAATEVEVPIDIEVSPGTSRISLNIKLVLSLRRR